MKILTFLSSSSVETIEFAKKLASLLKRGQVVGLFGNLGSGKTTFVKGLAKGLGIKGRVNSPSFVILKVYSSLGRGSRNKREKKKDILLYHFDLYRLSSLKELEDVGYEDFISNSGICVIEWANKAEGLLPKNYLKLQIQIKNKNTRLIRLTSYGCEYDNLITELKAR